MQKKAIIFDYDGVLVESETSSFRILGEVLKKYDLDLPADLFQYKLGIPSTTFLKKYYLHAFTDEQIEKIYREYKATFVEKTTQVSKVHQQVIKSIKHFSQTHTIAIASMNVQRQIQVMLAHLAIKDKISLVLTHDEIKQEKPDPAIYLACLQQLNITADEAIVIEDSRSGIQAALGAGIDVIALKNEINQNIDLSDLPVLKISNTTDIFTDLEQLLG